MRHAAIILFAVAGIFVVSAGVARANSCTVTSISYNELQGTTSYKYGAIGCADGSSFYINLYSSAQPSCPLADIDSAKIMLGMAQSAKLAGKPLQVSWTAGTCPSPSGNFSANVLTWASL
ncbi:MAG TPA: hypothetical protein VG713_05315 [Pirellulales bacterium]|nr:hypothetical protein [Pirellulales bacterium]